MVFTIHNLEFGQNYIGEAAYYCQRFTTVSPTYAMEVLFFTTDSPVQGLQGPVRSLAHCHMSPCSPPVS